jgi:hypothetical protein
LDAAPSLRNIRTRGLVFDKDFDAGGSDVAVSKMAGAMTPKAPSSFSATAAAAKVQSVSIST